MTDDLIARLSADLKPVPQSTMSARLLGALGLGLLLSILLAYPVLHMLVGRPMGPIFGDTMFWIKGGYAIAFGLFGLAALPVLARPDGRINWPLIGAAILLMIALALGSMFWMQADWAMPELMGNTSAVCPLLIVLTGAPILVVVLSAVRTMAPRSATKAGFAAGLLAGGFGAAVYSIYCGETGMMFMAVWYSLGIAMTAVLGAIVGRFALRW